MRHFQAAGSQCPRISILIYFPQFSVPVRGQTWFSTFELYLTRSKCFVFVVKRSPGSQFEKPHHKKIKEAIKEQMGKLKQKAMKKFREVEPQVFYYFGGNNGMPFMSKYIIKNFDLKNKL